MYGVLGLCEPLVQYRRVLRMYCCYILRNIAPCSVQCTRILNNVPYRQESCIKAAHSKTFDTNTVSESEIRRKAAGAHLSLPVSLLSSPPPQLLASMATCPPTHRSSEEAHEAAHTFALNHVLGRGVDVRLISTHHAADSAVRPVHPIGAGAGAGEGGRERSNVEGEALQGVPELGTVRMKLGHEGMLSVASELPTGRFFIELEGRRYSGVLVWRKVSVLLRQSCCPLTGVTGNVQMLLPATLDAAQNMDFRRWNTIFKEVYRLFADVLSEDQLDAVKSVVYAYSWFGRTSTRAPAYNPVAMWGELQQLLFAAVNMTLHLGSTGEDMMMNVWMWARQRIPVRLHC